MITNSVNSHTCMRHHYCLPPGRNAQDFRSSLFFMAFQQKVSFDFGLERVTSQRWKLALAHSPRQDSKHLG